MKHLELIHKDIDKTISLNEKEKLDKYLNTNPEANILHKELLRTEELLDKLPDNEPSENLKKKILNQIDYNRYAHKKEMRIIPDYISSLFSGPRKKITTSFSLGFITGILIFSLIFYVSYYNNSSEVHDIFGTMGLSETEIVESFTVNSTNISGEIEIIKGLNFYRFKINLNSSERYNLQIEFDPTNVSLR